MNQILLSAAAGTLLSLVGCAAETDTDSIELKEGLNLLDVSDPAWGVVAAYVRDGNAVMLETRVGPLKPEIYRETMPNEPMREMDVRFVDRNGIMFYAIRGGDQFIDPTWADDVGRAIAAQVPAQQRDLDFVLAQEAAQAFLVASPEGTADHLHHFANVAQMVPPAMDPAMQARAEQAELARPHHEYSTWGAGSSTYLSGDLYSKSCCGGFGMHSAVAQWYYQSGWALAINACNHGTCAGAGDIYYNGSAGNLWHSSVSIGGEHTTSTAVGSGACTSPYDWASGGMWGDGNDHLCNSDAAYEMFQMKNGNMGGSSWGTNGNGQTFRWYGGCVGGDCGGGSNAYYSCTCKDAFGDCDNDYGRPVIP